MQRDRREEKRNEDGKQSDDAVLRKAVREMRRRSFLEIEEVQRLSESRNENIRQIANAAVDFLAFDERPLSSAWPTSSTWAKVIKASLDHGL